MCVLCMYVSIVCVCVSVRMLVTYFNSTIILAVGRKASYIENLVEGESQEVVEEGALVVDDGHGVPEVLLHQEDDDVCELPLHEVGGARQARELILVADDLGVAHGRDDGQVPAVGHVCQWHHRLAAAWWWTTQ